MDLAGITTSSSLLMPKKKVDLVRQVSKPRNSEDGMLPRRRGSSSGSSYHMAADYGQNHPSYRKETSKEKMRNKFVAQSNSNGQKSILPPTVSLSMDWEERRLENKSNKSVECIKQEDTLDRKCGEISTDSLVSMVCGSPAFYSGSIPAAGKESRYSKVPEFSKKERSSDLYEMESSDKKQDEDGRLITQRLDDIHLESTVNENFVRNPLMRSISTESLMHETPGLAYLVKRRMALVPESISHNSSSENIRDHGSTHVVTECIGNDDTLAFWTFIPVFAVIGCLSFLYSSAMSFGALLGATVAFVFLRSYAWFMHPTVVKVYIPSVDAPLVDLPEHSVKTVPRNLNESVELKAKVFTGWLNLLEGVNYIPEQYHISNTITINATLEYTVLRMQKPQTEVPKRAMWDEPDHKVKYVKQVTVDVRNYKLELLPTELVKSRIWSKKYPICLIRHGHGSVVGRPLTADELAVFDSRFTSPQRIYLFARTSKEKEEWFRRLDQACLGQPITTLISELQRWTNVDIQNQLQNEQEKVTNKPKYSAANVKPDRSKRHRRSLSEGSSQSITPSISKLSAKKLAGRNHNILLIEYIKCLMSVMEKSSKFEPSIAGRSEVTSCNISTGTTLSPSASANQRIPSANKEKRSISPSRISSFLSYGKNKFGRTQFSSPTDSTTSSPVSIAAEDKPAASSVHCDTGVLWVNVILQRIFFDFFREEYWKLRMQSKIQKKLDKINLPYYIDQLILSEIHLGKNLPLIKHIGQPYLSDNGLWLDSQIAYDGGVTMTIETKINLITLKKDERIAGGVTEEDKKEEAVPMSAITDEDADDSEESSTSTDEPQQSSPESTNRVTRLFNQLKESKYFQQLANTRLIRSAIDKVSNTKLKLSVEIKFLAGTFCVNIPPPPTDRIWFGFRNNPKLILFAKPVVGEKSVNVARLSEWIEKKMTTEFQRLLVIPNMVDQQIPFMCAHYTPNSPAKKRHRKSKMRTSRSDMSATTEHMMS